MALVFFSSLVDEIVGKLAGSVFQYSQGGYQVHTRIVPRNPQTQYQQLRRGEFGFLSASWRSLTTTQRNTFIANTPIGISTLDFFIRQNVNLVLINEATINSYTATTTPTDFAVAITTANPDEFTITASGMVTTVPPGQKLLVFCTNCKDQTKIFTNPSEFSPIISFDEGTDLSAPTSILTAFNDRFGQLTADQYLCVKTVLIDKSNGNRGVESISCSNTSQVPNKYFNIASTLTDSPNVGTGLTVLWSVSVPANTLIADGDKLLFRASGLFVTPTTAILSLTFAGDAFTLSNISSNQSWDLSGYIQRVSSSVYRIATIVNGNFNNVINITVTEGTGKDFTIPITFEIRGQASASGEIVLKQGYIDCVNV